MLSSDVYCFKSNIAGTSVSGAAPVSSSAVVTASSSSSSVSRPPIVTARTEDIVLHMDDEKKVTSAPPAPSQSYFAETEEQQVIGVVASLLQKVNIPLSMEQKDLMQQTLLLQSQLKLKELEMKEIRNDAHKLSSKLEQVCVWTVPRHRHADCSIFIDVSFSLGQLSLHSQFFFSCRALS